MPRTSTKLSLENINLLINFITPTNNYYGLRFQKNYGRNEK